MVGCYGNVFLYFPELMNNVNIRNIQGAGALLKVEFGSILSLLSAFSCFFGKSERLMPIVACIGETNTNCFTTGLFLICYS